MKCIFLQAPSMFNSYEPLVLLFEIVDHTSKCITRVQIVNKDCWSCMATLTAWCVRHVELMRRWNHGTESYRRWLVVIDAVVGSDLCGCRT